MNNRYTSLRVRRKTKDEVDRLAETTRLSLIEIVDLAVSHFSKLSPEERQAAIERPELITTSPSS